ncbi:hypothetical protein EVA_17542 [gut metagenome]|uniref:Uncharacterized protein n=1 Tax=gut metagenome TaxID=749906 RepID=J9C3F0_9ZZZZ
MQCLVENRKLPCPKLLFAEKELKKINQVFFICLNYIIATVLVDCC